MNEGPPVLGTDSVAVAVAASAAGYSVLMLVVIFTGHMSKISGWLGWVDSQDISGGTFR